jgi:hypothetical protein
LALEEPEEEKRPGKDGTPGISKLAFKKSGPYWHIYFDPAMGEDILKRMQGTELPGSGYMTELQQGGLRPLAVGAIGKLMEISLLQPLLQTVVTPMLISDVALEYTPEGAWTIKLMKALDPGQRFLITYNRVMGYQTGEIQRLYGMEYRFRRRMLLRVSQDQDGRYYLWLQGKLGF